MFDTIAPRYDLLNRINSFGLDRGWRRRTVEALQLLPGHRVLDLATGTADLAIELAEKLEVEVVGLDPSVEMLAIGRQKVAKVGLQARVNLVEGDAQTLQFPDGHFDRVTIAFGIRNVPDRLKALKEIERVLKRGGRLAVLELSEPKQGLLGKLAQLHVSTVVPTVGALLSGGDAYRYLRSSIAAFPPAEEFKKMIEAAGLNVQLVEPMTFGACHLYVAQKS
ncbi:MAG: bifunctional demethylmenaquinone methyltransferase/2-methoxy-6-polyprenyl-1,4-benzoquinol methylase UbiE [Deltaproteobacteria bacterium]|nr:bifunctional demethylmenaquinone methyltransferase/2-methoxy-6-polyprenyl-1,4-benzoquinol methylase UbiE [Deltaproteobacteria bacterium]